MGVTNNTIAHIPDLTNPRKSDYMYKEALVPEFVPFTASEHKFCTDEENKKENRRLVAWNFGGIIEDKPGSGTGWVFFDKLQTHGGMIEKGFGMGVARARLDGKFVKVERESDDMIFGDEEPRFGSISPLIDTDGFVYLLGSKDMANYMARVPLNADFRSRASYSFLTKSGWQATYSKLDDLEPVLGDQAQGSLFKLPYNSGFAPFKKPYMWLGVNKWMDSKMWIACAEKIEGPWQYEFLGMAPLIMGENSGHRYCLYPHFWGSNLAEGKLLISWSDDAQMGGKVGCAYIDIKMEQLSAEQAQELQQLQEQEDRHSKAQPVAAVEVQQSAQQLPQDFAGLNLQNGSAQQAQGAPVPEPAQVSAAPSQDFTPQNETLQSEDTAKHEKHPHLHALKSKLKGIVHEHKH